VSNAKKRKCADERSQRNVGSVISAIVAGAAVISGRVIGKRSISMKGDFQGALSSPDTFEPFMM
jgi:hypothetical protein